MEDIYDDLNNYEDINCVQELRNENMELKVKLEQHAAAMEKLQKDYDKLEKEFKKLEYNYSSLLKTARSEIERKTQRITQLNMDKDMMVLESLKYGKSIRRNFNKNVQGQVQGIKKGEESNKLKNIDKRCNTTGVQTENYSNFVADNRIGMKNKFDDISAKPDSSYKSNNILREKLTHHKTEYNDTPKMLAGSIKNRRKSMPVVSIPDEKFSSDEENEHIYSVRETRTDSTQDKFERRHINKIPIDRHSNKTSESSSIDDKASNYHESTSRDYRGRTSRHDNNLYRSKDKYKTSLKYRKEYSPERGQKRQHSHNEYPDDYYRKEQGRYRPRDNPTSEHDRYQRRNADHRANHDRHSYDQEKYRHCEEKYGVKQKIPNDYDEPLTKRQKTEYFRNPEVINRVEKDYYNDKEFMDIQSPHQYDTQRLSCQSPDYVHTDTALEYPIKEIMATATIPLEDPRLTSKRYAIVKDNGKETLSAVVGKNIDIKSVNKALWNIERVKIPDALMRRPSLASYELVKDIDINIDRPVVDLSLESGEIIFESDNEVHEIREKSKVISHIVQDGNTSRPVSEDFSRQVINPEENSKPNVVKYRIPKIGENNKSSGSKKDVPIIDVSEGIPTTNLTKKISAEDDFPKKLLTRQQNDDHVNILPSNNNGSKHEGKEINVPTKNLTKNVTAEDDFPKKLLTRQQNDDHVNILPSNKNGSKHEGKEINVPTKNLTEKVTAEDDFPKLLTRQQNDDHVNVLPCNKNESKHEGKEINVPTKNLTKKVTAEDDFPKKLLTRHQNDDHVNMLPSNKNGKHEGKESKNESTLSKMAIVADDLELSDENSDNVDSNRDIITEKVTKYSKVQPNFRQTEDFKGDLKKHSDIIANTNKTKEPADTVESKAVEVDEKEKSKEVSSDSSKKQKSKKKKSKCKEVSKDSIEGTNADLVIDKKKRSKKEKECKPKGTNMKFNDLFGDSSSLMTPEDLGIPTYLPISEDAQDAVDLKINQIIDAPPIIDKAESSDGNQAQSSIDIKKQEVKQHDNKIEIDLQKSNTVDKEVTIDTKKKKPSKRKEEIDTIETHSHIYENLNPKTDLNEQDIVKTVIISTGVQPQIIFENNSEAVLEKSMADVKVHTNPSVTECHTIPAITDFKRQDILKALATSTPHKETVLNSVNEIKTTICDSNSSKTIESTGVQTVSLSNTNMPDSQDAPDVRIFVKRRRKVMKRPPMT